MRWRKKREQKLIKNKEQQLIGGVSKILQEFDGTHPKLNGKTKERAAAYSTARSQRSVSYIDPTLLHASLVGLSSQWEKVNQGLGLSEKLPSLGGV